MKLNGLRLRSETGEGLKNLNGKQIQICMHGFYSFWDGPGLRAGVGAADFLHVRHPIRVSAGPKAEVRMNAGSAFGRMPGLLG